MLKSILSIKCANFNLVWRIKRLLLTSLDDVLLIETMKKCYLGKWYRNGFAAHGLSMPDAPIPNYRQKLFQTECFSFVRNPFWPIACSLFKTHAYTSNNCMNSSLFIYIDTMRWLWRYFLLPFICINRNDIFGHVVTKSGLIRIIALAQLFWHISFSRFFLSFFTLVVVHRVYIFC